MKILLDENAPTGLRRILAGHQVRTAPEMGWARYANGQLLDEAEKAGFEALITGDRSLPYQQNLTGRTLPRDRTLMWLKGRCFIYSAGFSLTEEVVGSSPVARAIFKTKT